ncbi:MAG: 50S ribosomal protein L22 [Planctomycetaceae bacterium]|nr:50S ribosomal protein L22 [Planctomycetaceae bacterium]
MGLVRATHRHARISASKVRPFAKLIRGLTAAEGVEALRYLPNRGARLLEKVLKSAIANAEDRGVRNPDRLKIAECRVDGGPMFRRVRPRSRGMAHLLQRKMAHIHVGVDAPELG